MSFSFDGYGNKALVVWNIHNYDLSAAERDDLKTRFDADKDRARQSPLHYVILLGGDFNLEPED
eukprot:5640107-Karenia_brevis.AAC.1